MAEDWIKMRTDLYRDPKVCVIADLLMDPDGDLARYVDQHCQRHMTVTRNVMRNVTVGALVTVWGVTRLRGKREGDDILCRHATLSVIDDMAELPGLGAAMAAVGWAVETEEGLIFPNFFESYNVDPEGKSSSSGAERQRRYRERLKGESDGESDVTRDVTRDVTVTSRNAPREEKSREEKREVTPSAPSEKISLGDDGKWAGIPERLSTSWHEAYPAVNVPAELAKAAAWVIANPKNRKSNYARFLTNWLTRAQDTAKPVRVANGSSSGDYCNPNDKRYVN